MRVRVYHLEFLGIDRYVICRASARHGAPLHLTVVWTIQLGPPYLAKSLRFYHMSGSVDSFQSRLGNKPATQKERSTRRDISAPAPMSVKPRQADYNINRQPSCLLFDLTLYRSRRNLIPQFQLRHPIPKPFYTSIMHYSAIVATLLGCALLAQAKPVPTCKERRSSKSFDLNLIANSIQKIGNPQRYVCQESG